MTLEELNNLQRQGRGCASHARMLERSRKRPGASRETLRIPGHHRLLFCLLECDAHALGAVFAHLAEEEQGPACDWDHMQQGQVMRVIGHTATAQLVIQTAGGSLAALSRADCQNDGHLFDCVQEDHRSPGLLLSTEGNKKGHQ